MLIYSANSQTSTFLVNNSLRLRRSVNAQLSRTTGFTGQNSWVFSIWLKRGALSSDMRLLAVDANNFIGFNATDNIVIQASGSAILTTTAVYRDVSSWYHIVVKRTSTTYTVYVNGVLISTVSASGGTIGDGLTNHYIGGQGGSSNTFDGYIAELNWAGGTSPAYTDFGAINPDTGVWSPKTYTGSYGSIGSYLNFSDNSALTTSSNVGLGKDFSGLGNYWTTSNISITAGTTYDSMTDVPTLTSATQANYPTASKLVPFRTWTNYTNGNLTINNGNINTNFVAVANMTFGTGKYYWETTITAVGAGAGVGLMKIENISGSNSTIDLGTAVGTYNYSSSGSKQLDGTSSSYGSSYTTGDVIGMTYDGSTGVVTAYKNNTSQGTMTTLSTATQYIAAWGCSNTTSTATQNINFGQRPFTYTPPSGFTALNTYTLATPTIGANSSTLANKYMDATLYTGTGATQSITNAGSFQPDLVWMKSRSGTFNNNLYDSIRGVTKELDANNTNAETTSAGALTSFNSNGWTLGNDTGTNTNGTTYVGWQWQAGQGTTSSNTAGSITSTTSVNATAGFSIVTYTGTGANATVGHGLGVAPKMVIVKSRSAATSWNAWHTALLGTQVIYLEQTAAAATNTAKWNSTTPTSTVISLGSDNGTNASSGTFVAYCWAEIEGFSKFGSYTGNGSTDGTFVYTGFRPRFILAKMSSTTSQWLMIDTSRDTYNVANHEIQANANSAESTLNDYLDVLSNGFKAKSSNMNNSGATIIYAAFAENPFKYSLAR